MNRLYYISNSIRAGKMTTEEAMRKLTRIIRTIQDEDVKIEAIIFRDNLDTVKENELALIEELDTDYYLGLIDQEEYLEDLVITLKHTTSKEVKDLIIERL